MLRLTHLATVACCLTLAISARSGADYVLVEKPAKDDPMASTNIGSTTDSPSI